MQAPAEEQVCCHSGVPATLMGSCSPWAARLPWLAGAQLLLGDAVGCGQILSLLFLAFSVEVSGSGVHKDKGLEQLSYEERLSELGMVSLGRRRLQEGHFL